MTSSTPTIRRFVQGIAIAIAAAALVAPASLGGNVSRNGTQDPWFRYAVSLTAGDKAQHSVSRTQSSSAATHDPWYGYAVSLTAQDAGPRFITDTLGGNGVPAPAPGYRFITDTLAPGGGGTLVEAPAVGFDWTDAGVGAAGAIGALLLAIVGSALVARRRGRLAF